MANFTSQVHPSAELVRRFGNGEMHGSEADQIADHLEKCDECCRQLHELTNNPVLVRLQAAVAGGGDPSASPLTWGVDGGWPSVPGYEILGEIGRGGMGVVYKARQAGLKRVVALKMILGGSWAGKDERARFVREAEAVARLQHPNIVQIHQTGEHEGNRYFSLEYCDGGNLAGLLSGAPLPAEDAAHVVRLLARAVQAAHDQNIIHRDLKPANVLLANGPRQPSETAAPSTVIDGGKPTGNSRSGPGAVRLGGAVPKITDFGLAKHLDEAGQTASGAVMGTPSYMAPEQASGETKTHGPAADIYALGAILYECLTGRPPFKAASSLETIKMVVDNEPVPPSQLNAKTPRDLETICLKCLQKEPGKRYAAAAELADDLAHFEKGEPIAARPVGTVERAWRWCRRKPVVAGLLALVALVVVTGVAGILHQLDPAVTAESKERRKSDALNVALEEEKQAKQRATNAEWSEKKKADDLKVALVRAETTVVDMYTASGLTASDRHEPDQAMLWFASAARHAEHDPERRRLNRTRVEAWRRQLAFVPYRAFAHAADTLRICAFHPGGGFLLTVSVKDRCNLWNVPREEAMPLPGGDRPLRSAAWSPDGTLLALGNAEADVEIYSFPAGKHLQTIKLAEPIEVLAFSRDGRYLAFAGKTAAVWDLGARAFALKEQPHPSAVISLAFNCRGDRLATGCDDGKARVFAVKSGNEAAGPLYPPVWHITWCSWLDQRCGRPSAPIFLDNDRVLLTAECLATQEGRLTARDAETGRPLRAAIAIGDVGTTLTLSPDGWHFAVTGNAGIYLWDAFSGRKVGVVLRTEGPSTAAFSPDGRFLTANGQIWTVPGGQHLEHSLHHHRRVYLACYSPDGRLMATAQDGGLVRVWAAADPPRDWQLPHNGICSFARLSKDGKAVLAAGMSFRDCQMRSTQVRELATGEPISPALQPGGIIKDAALAPDGRTVVLVSGSNSLDRFLVAALERPPVFAGSATFYAVDSGKPRFAAVELPAEPRCVSYSPDGKLAAVICAAGQVALIDTASGEVRRRLQSGPLQSRENNDWINNGKVRFGPDGKLLFTWGTDSDTIRAWDTATGQLRYKLPHKVLFQNYVEFSADGRLLTTSGPNHSVKVHEVETGKLVAKPLPHSDMVFASRFSADGSQLLTACGDSMARLWDWRAGRLVCPPFKHVRCIVDAAFTPDGRWILTASEDRTARVWEAHTGNAVFPPLQLRGKGMQIAVASDRAVAANMSNSLPAFDLGCLYTPERLNLEDTCLWCELLSGHSIHGSGMNRLTVEEWLERWRDFRKRHPDNAALGLAPPGITWGPISQPATIGGGVGHDSRSLNALYDLGAAMHKQKDLAAAALAYKNALAIEPCSAVLWHSLGRVLADQNSRSEAIAAFRKALESDPVRAAAHLDLALALKANGDFAAALAAARRGHDVGSQTPNWNRSSAQLVKQCEALLALERRLPAVAGGEETAEAGVLVEMAVMCQEFKKSYVMAAHLYAQAFQLRHVLADDLDSPHRYNAACAAVRAGCGHGDAAKLDEAAKAALRLRARDWLQADLAFYAQQLAKGPAIAPILVAGRLPHWQRDADLAGIRDMEDLKKLPHEERQEWLRLWTDVQKMLKTAQARVSETRLEGSLTAKQKSVTHEHKMVAGKTYVLDLESSDFETLLKLQDSHGKVLAENDDISEDNSNSRLIFTPPADGSYRLIAASYQGKGTGAYSLRIREIAGDAQGK